MLRLLRAVVLLVVTIAIAVLGAACGSSSSADGVDFPKVLTLGKGDIFPSITNQSLALGENRVSISLTDRDDNRVLGAGVHVKFYNLNGSKPVFSSEADARFVPVRLSYIDEQSATPESTPSGDDGVYVAQAAFDATGDWGVQIGVTRGGKALAPIPFRFNVLERSAEPGIGDAAPASVQQTLATAARIEDIDSSYPPRPQMHGMTVAEAIASGRPSVIAFATPAFCRSRTCGPVMDTVMDPLYAKHSARANFIHVEPYDLAALREANIEHPVAATREWNLQSEPWVFVVDGHGKVAAKFEGIMGEDEVESALVGVLGR
jgi:hypothetical protein